VVEVVEVEEEVEEEEEPGADSENHEKKNKQTKLNRRGYRLGSRRGRTVARPDLVSSSGLPKKQCFPAL
jgi:hypothetical protein